MKIQNEYHDFACKRKLLHKNKEAVEFQYSTASISFLKFIFLSARSISWGRLPFSRQAFRRLYCSGTGQVHLLWG